ncbi:MAG: apolipoprotein N-acyltransferase [Lentisphaerae bacterium]|nr:apolipoprotein N-acyltransferase [Lentisphaerota bacterium]
MMKCRFFTFGFAWRTACSLLSGILLACAFPPVEESIGVWFALVPALFVSRFTGSRGSFCFGLLSGIVFWLLCLSWLLQLRLVGGNLPLVILGWISLSVYCAAYMAAFFMIASFLLRFKERTMVSLEDAESRWLGIRDQLFNIALMFGLGVIWVGFEYLRSALFTGFPWNALGISQYRNTALIQIAEYVGVYGVSALIVVVNVALLITTQRIADVYLRRRKYGGMRIDLLVALVAVALTTFHGLGIMRRRNMDDSFVGTVRIAAVQPNVPQTQKWSREAEEEVYDTLYANTELALAISPDIIIWPETSLPGAVGADMNAEKFASRLAANGTYLLVGAMEVEWDEHAKISPSAKVPPHRLYNSSILFNPTGDIEDRYRKQRLVPFGEFIPLDKTLVRLQDYVPIQGSCTPGSRRTVFRIEIVDPATGVAFEAAFSALICFEDIFPSLARRFVIEGARMLVNQTNDGWFDGSSVHVQHMSHCVFRCVENRVPAVRASNTGVTCFIKNTGAVSGIHMADRKDWGIGMLRMLPGCLSVNGRNMQLTLYTKFGDILFALPCAIIACVGFVLVAVAERRQILREQ